MNIEGWLVDKPDTDLIFVAVSHVRPCYPEPSDASWTGPRKGQKRHRPHPKKANKHRRRKILKVGGAKDTIARENFQTTPTLGQTAPIFE